MQARLIQPETKCLIVPTCTCMYKNNGRIKQQHHTCTRTEYHTVTKRAAYTLYMYTLFPWAFNIIVRREWGGGGGGEGGERPSRLHHHPTAYFSNLAVGIHRRVQSSVLCLWWLILFWCWPRKRHTHFCARWTVYFFNELVYDKLSIKVTQNLSNGTKAPTRGTFTYT